jgi:hypothetical protein
MPDAYKDVADVVEVAAHWGRYGVGYLRTKS